MNRRATTQMQNSDEQTIMAIFIVCVDPEENWKGEESEADAVDALDEDRKSVV